MANRDLFVGGQPQGYREGRQVKNGLGIMRRLLGQSVAALVIFGAVVGLYEQESALGEGVRYVVALASADQQEIMAVGNFGDFIGRFGVGVDDFGNVQGDMSGEVGDGVVVSDGDEQTADGQAVHVDAVGGIDPAVDGDAADMPPGDVYLAAAQDAEGDPVLILPVSGLMESAFGDIDANGLNVLGLKIYCQGEQQVKAAAVGKVIEVLAGQSILIGHSGGIESRYCGDISPDVAVGDTLRQGQTIGTVEEGELLFQVLREGEAQDPFLFLQGPE